MTKAEDAIRNYLTALKDPDSLRDDKRVQELDKAIEDATDVLEEAKLMAEQSRLTNIKADDYVEGFIQHGKDWAVGNNIPADTLKAMGVPPAVLSKAGFNINASPAKKSTRTRVSRQEVVDCVMAQGDTFKLTDVEDQTGASLATVRKVVSDLVDDKKVEDIGPDPDHEGRGRAATLYKTA